MLFQIAIFSCYSRLALGSHGFATDRRAALEEEQQRQDLLVVQDDLEARLHDMEKKVGCYSAAGGYISQLCLIASDETLWNFFY